MGIRPDCPALNPAGHFHLEFVPMCVCSARCAVRAGGAADRRSCEAPKLSCRRSLRLMRYGISRISGEGQSGHTVHVGRAQPGAEALPRGPLAGRGNANRRERHPHALPPSMPGLHATRRGNFISRILTTSFVSVRYTAFQSISLLTQKHSFPHIILLQEPQQAQYRDLTGSVSSLQKVHSQSNTGLICTPT